MDEWDSVSFSGLFCFWFFLRLLCNDEDISLKSLPLFLIMLKVQRWPLKTAIQIPCKVVDVN